jgi:apolipoprotein D and lipocalin family protein
MKALKLLVSLATAAVTDPTTVPVDLGRYLGTWYEIARFDHVFERGCEDVTATYERRPNGDIGVVNSCVKGGKTKAISGHAWVPDPDVSGKLKVQFFWPFSAPYWVLDLAPDYAWALVGSPDRSNCWILSRTPVIPEELYGDLSARLRAKGFDPAKLIRIPQHVRSAPAEAR